MKLGNSGSSQNGEHPESHTSKQLQQLRVSQNRDHPEFQANRRIQQFRVFVQDMRHLARICDYDSPRRYPGAGRSNNDTILPTTSIFGATLEYPCFFPNAFLREPTQQDIAASQETVEKPLQQQHSETLCIFGKQPCSGQALQAHCRYGADRQQLGEIASGLLYSLIPCIEVVRRVAGPPLGVHASAEQCATRCARRNPVCPCPSRRGGRLYSCGC